MNEEEFRKGPAYQSPGDGELVSRPAPEPELEALYEEKIVKLYAVLTSQSPGSPPPGTPMTLLDHLIENGSALVNQLGQQMELARNNANETTERSNQDCNDLADAVLHTTLATGAVAAILKRRKV